MDLIGALISGSIQAYFVRVQATINCLSYSNYHTVIMPTRDGRLVKPSSWEPVTGPQCQHTAKFGTRCRSWSVTKCELCDRPVRHRRTPAVRSYRCDQFSAQTSHVVYKCSIAIRSHNRVCGRPSHDVYTYTRHTRCIVLIRRCANDTQPSASTHTTSR